MMKPRSCDTFVALAPATKNGAVVFGKNSDRPCDEVQEVVHIAAQDYPANSKVQCTYIEIDQVPHTHAVILSKPSWMWGAEMGANEHGVCIGNEAVWTKLQGPEDEEEKLLGMDLLRLALERGATAESALTVLCDLLALHGQGGTCQDDDGAPWTYHNSFIVCDAREAWVMETTGKHWAAERLTSGVRNISNQLTIRTTITKHSAGLHELAQSKGWWSPDDGPLDFAKVFSESFEETALAEGERPSGRQLWGTHLLRQHAQAGGLSAVDMMSILRHGPSGICMTGGFSSTGSQVSVLSSTTPSVHWFTGTPNPEHSMYKPFIFCEGATIGESTKSPDYGDEDPRKVKPRFQKKVERQHALWRGHDKLATLLARRDPQAEVILAQVRELEQNCVADMDDMVAAYDPAAPGAAAKVAQVFQHMADIEMNFYNMSKA